MKNVLFVAIFSLLAGKSMAFETMSNEEIYEYFYGIESRRECRKHTSCRMLRRHIIRDSKTCRINPIEVGVTDNFVLQSSGARENNVTGSMRYLGVVPAKYGYDTYFDITGTIVIEGRIHFSNLDEFSETTISRLENRFKAASDVWTNGNRFSDYPVRFSLKLERNRRNAHISARLQDDWTRGPYFSKWSLSWSIKTLAHEFGHILGLDDEYSNTPLAGVLSRCNKRSIMCSPYGVPQDYQYYVIFRRLLCKD